MQLRAIKLLFIVIQLHYSHFIIYLQPQPHEKNIEARPLNILAFELIFGEFYGLCLNFMVCVVWNIQKKNICNWKTWLFTIFIYLPLASNKILAWELSWFIAIKTKWSNPFQRTGTEILPSPSLFFPVDLFSFGCGWCVHS